MRKNTIYVISLIALIFFVLVYLFVVHENQKKVDVDDPAQIEHLLDQWEKEDERALKQRSSEIDEAEKEASKKMEDQIKEGNERLKNVTEFVKLGNKDISFYLQLLDQYGDPVSDAEITISVAGAFGLENPEIKTYSSDSRGLALVDKVSGYRVRVISVEKDGYRFKDIGHAFYSYNDIGGVELWSDYENKPYTINLWRISDQTINLLSGGAVFRSREVSGKIFQFEPLALDSSGRRGNIAQGNEANITFGFVRNDIPHGDAHEKNAWQFNIMFKAGGMREVGQDEVFVYEAPLDGYSELWSIKIDENSSNWQSRVDRKFYFKTFEGGRELYGLLDVSVMGYTGSGHAAVRFVYSLNPDGKRAIGPG